MIVNSGPQSPQNPSLQHNQFYLSLPTAV